MERTRVSIFETPSLSRPFQFRGVKSPAVIIKLQGNKFFELVKLNLDPRSSGMQQRILISSQTARISPLLFIFQSPVFHVGLEINPDGFRLVELCSECAYGACKPEI